MRRSAIVAAAVAIAAACDRLGAQAAEVVLVPDIAIELPGLAAPLLDRTAVRERIAPPIQRRIVDEVPEIPDGVDFAALGYANHGVLLFALDGWVELPGAGLVGPLDVVAKEGGAYAVRFAGHDAGIPDGVAIDAISLQNLSGQISLSFDSDFAIGVDTYRDTDVVYVLDGEVQFAFPLGFDLLPGLDVDGLGGGPGGGIYDTVSFDGSGVVGGIAFDDEDIVAYHGNGDWELLYDASLAGPGWKSADLAAFTVLASYLFMGDFEFGETDPWSDTVP